MSTSAFLISYDLKFPGGDYSGLYKELKHSPTKKWWHHVESTWIILTDESAGELWARIKSNIDKDDTVIIIEVRDNASGWLTERAWNWIHENVPKSH